MGTFGIDAIFPNGLALDDALRVLLPVAWYVLGMAVYAVFIFKFYRFIAARDIFHFDLSQNDASRVPGLRDFLSLVGYVIKYVVLFPAFAFFWFAVLTVMLAFLSEERGLPSILVIALATVSTIRLCAYYDEDLSRDLAKILPFAVLAIFLIDTTFFDVDASLSVLRQVGGQWDTIVYYWLFLIVLEFGLRLIYGLFRAIFPARQRAAPTRATTPDAPAAASDD